MFQSPLIGASVMTNNNNALRDTDDMFQSPLIGASVMTQGVSDWLTTGILFQSPLIGASVMTQMKKEVILTQCFVSIPSDRGFCNDKGGRHEPEDRQ